MCALEVWMPSLPSKVALELASVQRSMLHLNIYIKLTLANGMLHQNHNVTLIRHYREYREFPPNYIAKS